MSLISRFLLQFYIYYVFIVHYNYLMFIFFRTKWKSESNTRGSYTAVAVGASQTDIENIARPLYSSPIQTKVLIFIRQIPTPANITHCFTD